jgi:hypothetical protein
MNAPAAQSSLILPGTPVEGGFHLDTIQFGGNRFNLILPPKAIADHAPTVWNKSLKRVDGALSLVDGYANTVALAAAGSEIATWALDMRVYIPAVDELERAYRWLKPGRAENWCFLRSGINLHAIPPTHPYTHEDPKQTAVEIFRAGGTEAFEEEAYWTSTQQDGPDPDFAWYQDLYVGNQLDTHKSVELRVRVLRRSPIIQ